MGLLSAMQPPEGSIKWQQEGVSTFIEKQDLSKGTLFVAESHVAWINSSGQGFNIPYRAISLHAVSRDLSAFPHECLYLMIDAELMGELKDIPGQSGDGPSGDGQSDDDGIEEDEGNVIREIRFIPQDKSVLQSMFEAMSQCQALHPDPDDSEPSDTSETFEECDEEEVEVDDTMDTGQFDDADMDPEH